MGCDIHLHPEVQDNGTWCRVTDYPRHVFDASLPCNVERDAFDRWHADLVDSGEWNMGRNYRFFARLAGVRNYDNEYQPLFELRGTPADVSPSTKTTCSQWGMNAHSHTWATVRELLDEQLMHLGGDQWQAILGELVHICDGDLDSVRVVFWFDN